MKFNKPYLSFSDQISLLEQRGLAFSDKTTAENRFSLCNYYRLSGYMLPFELRRHQFLPGATFEQVWSLYEFDQRLRDVVSHALTWIEIFTKAKIACALAEKSGPFAHLNSVIFAAYFNRLSATDSNSPRLWQQKVVEETVRSRDTFVEHFKATYDEWPNLPICAVTELISFGSIVRLFKLLDLPIKKSIAREFAFPFKVVESWLLTLSYIRNICAHHGRFWNRVFSIRPAVPDSSAGWNIFDSAYHQLRPFCALTIIHCIIKRMAAATGVDLG